MYLMYHEMCHNLAWVVLCKLNALQSEREEKERESGLDTGPCRGLERGRGR